VVGNCLGAVWASEFGESAWHNLHGVICVLIVFNERCTGQIKSLAPGVVLELPIGFDIGPAA
jgi:hypothetical protein